MFVPYLTGDWDSANMTWEIGTGGGLGLALTWLYFMGWSAYGFEVVAAFAPEYHDPERDTPRALRASAAVLGASSTRCCRSAWAARSAPRPWPTTPPFIAFYNDAFDKLVGNAPRPSHDRVHVAGLVLSMNTATMDGSRALYGIAKDGMTTKWLGRAQQLQRARARDDAGRAPQHLPDHVLRRCARILAAGNIGYMLAHVCALSGFLLLRKDRPNWPRPIRLSAVWVPIAAVLVGVNSRSSSPAGSSTRAASSGSTGYGYGWDKTRIGLLVLLGGLLLYV